MQLTSREFNQRVAQAQKAAQKAPVFITNRGKPAYVLLSQAQYEQLTQQQPSIAQVLAASDDVDFACERAEITAREVVF
ncbi:type II toxin-antitoxin system prevent-host-death family antitoxin [Neisseriaceae bacterium B1]